MQVVVGSATLLGFTPPRLQGKLRPHRSRRDREPSRGKAWRDETCTTGRLAPHVAAGAGGGARGAGGRVGDRHHAQPRARAALGDPARRRHRVGRLSRCTFQTVADSWNLRFSDPSSTLVAAGDRVGRGAAQPDQRPAHLQPRRLLARRPLPRHRRLLLDAGQPRELGARDVRRRRPARHAAARQVRGRQRQRHARRR